MDGDYGIWHEIQDGFCGDFAKPGDIDVWDRFLFKDYSSNWNFNEDKYITVTIDGNTETEKVFIDGELMASGKFKPEDNVWQKFIESLKSNCDMFFVGSCSNGGPVGYLNASAYVFRMYGKGLTDEEVKMNCRKSIETHSKLKN